MLSIVNLTVVKATPSLDFEKNSVILLDNDEWKFYYASTYKDIQNNFNLTPISIKVPGNWSSAGLPNTGFGTYVLRFTHNQKLTADLALKMQAVSCAYQLYVNGKLLRETGVFSSDATKEQADFYPFLVNFLAEKDTIEIAIQVSNFNYRNGGLWYTPMIGLPEPIGIVNKRNFFKEAFLLGSLIFLFACFLTLYYIKTSDKTSLYFALMCLFAALRILSTGEILLRQLNVGIPWEFIIKLEYISLVLTLYFGFAYLRCLFILDFNTKIFRFIKIVQIFSAAAFLFLPVYYASFIIPFYLLFCVFLLLYLINLIVKINLAKRNFSLEVGVVCLLVILAAVNDILYSQSIIKTFYLLPAGILIFAAMQAMVITRLFSNAFNRVEQLSQELSDINKNQLQIIDDRTAELNLVAIELKQSNQIKDKVFSIISHDLRAPIKSLSTVLAWVVDDDLTFEDLKKSLNSINKNVDTLNLTIENLLQWSRSQVNGVKSEPDLIDIRRPIQEMFDLFKFQLNEKNITLKYDNAIRLTVFIDKHHLNLLLRNLLSNAIKFSNEGGDIRIVVKDYQNNQTLVEIIDIGIGMTQEALQKAFSGTEHYSTYGTNNERGTGLGLLLCKEYVEISRGKIWVESKEGVGTKVSFLLPNLPF